MKYFFLTVLLFASFISSAQTGYRQRLYHFTEKRPGDKAAGDSTILHYIYIEIAKDSMPLWQTAIIDGNTYTVHPTLVETSPLELGAQLKNKKKVVITPKLNNRLWKLELDLEKEKKLTTDPVSKTVVLRGLFKNQKISCTVSGEVELEPTN